MTTGASDLGVLGLQTRPGRLSDVLSANIMAGALCLLAVLCAGSEPVAGRGVARDASTDAEVIVITVGERASATGPPDASVDEGFDEVVAGDAAVTTTPLARPPEYPPAGEAAASPPARPSARTRRPAATRRGDARARVARRPEVADEFTPPSSPERDGYSSEAGW